MATPRRSRTTLRALIADRPSIAELRIGDRPEVWAALGFEVENAACRVGRVAIRFEGPGSPGINCWSLRGISSPELDGLPTELSDEPPGEPGEHPNGAVSIDHVVAFTPQLERTIAVLEAGGLDVRRIREGESMGHQVRQAFYRLDEALLEVVGPPAGAEDAGDGPARFWGLVVVVRDLDACAELLGEHLGPVKDAVQPGRRIATVRRSAGLSVPLALITPEPGR